MKGKLVVARLAGVKALVCASKFVVRPSRICSGTRSRSLRKIPLVVIGRRIRKNASELLSGPIEIR